MAANARTERKAAQQAIKTRMEHTGATPAQIAWAQYRHIGLTPNNPDEYTNTRTPWNSTCDQCNNPTAPRLSNLRNGAGGCTVCVHIAQTVNTNDAADEYQTHNVTPNNPDEYPGSHTGWPSTCDLCHTPCSPTLSQLRSGHNGCPECVRRNKLVPLQQQLDLLAAHNIVPNNTNGYVDSNTPWPGICTTCGTAVAPRTNNLKNGSGGCRTCHRTRVTPSSHTMNTRFIAAGVTPNNPDGYTNAHTGWPSTCQRCGSQCSPAWKNLQQGRGGCNTCNRGGYTNTKPGMLYLLKHPDHDAIKYGITNHHGPSHTSTRIKRHARGGWQTHRTWQWDNGATAQTIETLIKQWIRTSNIPAGNAPHTAFPAGGRTETVRKRHLSSLTRRINQQAVTK